VLREYGLMPKERWEQDRIATILSTCDEDGDGSIDFREFLNLVDQLREEYLVRMRGELRRQFDRYDRDQSGALGMSEVSLLFVDMGLNPSCQEDQDEIKQLLDNVDADGSGELDFDEFQDLVQRIEEKLKSLQRRRDLKAGEALGFTQPQVCELRGVFFKLDVNGDESISSNEIQRLAMLMRKRINQTKLMEVFHEVDGEDGNGSLEFVEFMEIVKRLELY